MQISQNPKYIETQRKSRCSLCFCVFWNKQSTLEAFHKCLVGMEHGSRGLEHVPCSAHVLHIVFRTCSEHPGLLFSLRKSPCGMPLADKRAQISEFRQFKKCLHFSFPKNRILKIVISTISMCPKIQIPMFEAFLA